MPKISELAAAAAFPAGTALLPIVVSGVTYHIPLEDLFGTAGDVVLEGDSLLNAVLDTYSLAPADLTPSASVTVPAGNLFYLAQAQNTTITLPAGADGDTCQIRITLSGTYTRAWAGGAGVAIDWGEDGEPTIGTASGHEDWYSFLRDDTKWAAARIWHSHS
jgi:hypothetical protein